MLDAVRLGSRKLAKGAESVLRGLVLLLASVAQSAVVTVLSWTRPTRYLAEETSPTTLERSPRTTACRRDRHPASRLVLPPVVQRGGHQAAFLLMARGATTSAIGGWTQDSRGAARTRAGSP